MHTPKWTYIKRVVKIVRSNWSASIACCVCLKSSISIFFSVLAAYTKALSRERTMWCNNYGMETISFIAFNLHASVKVTENIKYARRCKFTPNIQTGPNVNKFNTNTNSVRWPRYCFYFFFAFERTTTAWQCVQWQLVLMFSFNFFFDDFVSAHNVDCLFSVPFSYVVVLKPEKHNFRQWTWTVNNLTQYERQCATYDTFTSPKTNLTITICAHFDM